VLLATVPAGFTDTSDWASGLSNTATAMAFARDGRLFVSQQPGALRVITPPATPGGKATLLATPFVTKAVDSSGERGMLGVAFDPAFEENGYVYVYYTVPGAGVHNRVSRFTAVDADPDPAHYAPGNTAVAGSELPILDLDPLSTATNHNGGAIHFGLDGKLYVSVGENANPANSQTLTNRLGKMLRINPDGSIPEDNPFYTTASGANRAIWALGLRNPFTFAVQPGTGRIFINDVGQSAWEEVNEGRAGANYGWPTTEGDFNQASFPQFTRPLHAYGRTVGTVIAGGTFYNPAVQNFPSAYVGDYFFSDNGTGFIHKLEAPIPSTFQSASNFATGISGPVDLQVGPDGALYYLARFSGRVGRIAYTASLTPTISQQPTNQTADEGQPATFTVTATGDGTLSYRWQRQDAGAADFVDIPDATASTYTLASPTADDNGAKFRVVVGNSFGSVTSDAATLTVNARVPTVVGRHVFYNNSAFDGNDPASTAADDAAVATDKQALLPGQKATFANVTSYDKGINGIMLDVNGLPSTTTITAANFNFSTSPDGRTWTAAPAPQGVTVRPLVDSAAQIDRVTVTWPDGAIADEWLQVFFNPYPAGTPIAFGMDLSFFGNLRGETGDPNTSGGTILRVNSFDLAALRRGLVAGEVPLDNRFDFNRDKRTNALDLGVIRRNVFHQLPLFTAPTPPGPPPAGADRAMDLSTDEPLL